MTGAPAGDDKELVRRLYVEGFNSGPAGLA